MGVCSFSGDPLSTGWNLGAAATIILPLLMFMIAALVHRNKDEHGGDNENNGWSRWWQKNDRQPEDEGSGALIFCYFWMLLQFGLLWWYGDLVFRRDALILPLLTALITFCGLCFMGMILAVGLGTTTEEREVEENGWLGQWGACVALTFAFMTLYSGVFFFLLRRRHNVTNFAPSSSLFGSSWSQPDQQIVKGHGAESSNAADYRFMPFSTTTRNDQSPSTASQHQEQNSQQQEKAWWEFWRGDSQKEQNGSDARILNPIV